MASGTGKSQLYHYFADKDDLVDEVVRHQIGRVAAAQDPLLRGLDSMRGLERWRNAVVADVRSRRGALGCPLGSLDGELADHREPARQEIASGFSDWADRFRRGLERMQETGELRSDADPGTLATGLLAALQGGLLLARVQRSADSLEVALDMALDRIRASTRPVPTSARRRAARTIDEPPGDASP